MAGPDGDRDDISKARHVWVCRFCGLGQLLRPASDLARMVAWCVCTAAYIPARKVCIGGAGRRREDAEAME
jgi:hypothetical protein